MLGWVGMGLTVTQVADMRHAVRQSRVHLKFSWACSGVVRSCWVDMGSVWPPHCPGEGWGTGSKVGCCVQLQLRVCTTVNTVVLYNAVVRERGWGAPLSFLYHLMCVLCFGLWNDC